MKITKRLLILLIFILILGAFFYYSNYVSWPIYKDIRYPESVGFPKTHSWLACSDVIGAGCREFNDSNRFTYNQRFFLVSLLIGTALIFVLGKKRRKSS